MKITQKPCKNIRPVPNGQKEMGKGHEKPKSERKTTSFGCLMGTIFTFQQKIKLMPPIRAQCMKTGG